MGMSSGGNGQTVSEINVTPLVDVMLVLLIIFMVTAPMLNNAGVEIDLPRAEAPPLDMNDDDQLILSIDGNGDVFIGDNAVDQDTLPAKLLAIAKANPDKPVFLRADGNLPYKDVVKILGVAKQSGMPKVGLVFEPMGSPEEEN